MRNPKSSEATVLPINLTEIDTSPAPETATDNTTDTDTESGMGIIGVEQEDTDDEASEFGIDSDAITDHNNNNKEEDPPFAGTDNEIGTEIPAEENLTDVDQEQNTADTNEKSPASIELTLTPDGKLTQDAMIQLRQALPATEQLLESDQKLSFRELQAHIPAGIQIAAAAVVAMAVLEAFFLAVLSRKPTKVKKAANAEEKEKQAILDAEERFDITMNAENITVASLHNIGRRKSQQDCWGTTRVQNGLFAVVADGMGGLADGDRVSQQIVHTMLGDAGNNGLNLLNGNLNRMVAHANEDVNHLLGQPEEYVSGSTLIAALAEPGQFQWISVGDSRIYLYRRGVLLQLNREHIYESELLNMAVNGEISFQEAHNHARKKSVSSFIGMGRLKYIDEPLRPIPALVGDRLLLTSDGVFNTLSDDEIAAILRCFPDPNEAMSKLEEAVLQKNNPYQDNFTSVLIAWQ